jgi:hypothetical protein
MVCGFCNQVGHNRLKCQSIKTTHLQLQSNVNKEQIRRELEAFNLKKSRILLEELHPCYREAKHNKTECLNLLISFYIDKNPVGIEVTPDVIFGALHTVVNSLNTNELAVMSEETVQRKNHLLNLLDFMVRLSNISPNIKKFSVKKKEKETETENKETENKENEETENKETENKKTEDCPICMMSEVSVLTNCKHAYCFNCVTTALQYNSNCPCCRTPIDSLFIHHFT